MTKLLDIFVSYQKDGVPHEKIVEVPLGLSNSDCIDFIRASVGEDGTILYLVNIDTLNRQKAPHDEFSSDERPKMSSGQKPQRRSASRPSFGGDFSRPYGESRSRGFSARGRGDRPERQERPSGGYAGRSPRDGAKPGFGGFGGGRPSRGAPRDARAGGRTSRGGGRGR